MKTWRIRVALMAAVALGVDWGSKAWAVAVGGDRLDGVDPQVNDGYALGAVTGPSVLLALASLALLVTVVRYTGRRRSQYVAAGVGLLVGGGLANGLERLVHGAVSDFIVVGPVLINFADVTILVGVVVLTVDYVRANLRPRITAERRIGRSLDDAVRPAVDVEAV